MKHVFPLNRPPRDLREGLVDDRGLSFRELAALMAMHAAIENGKLLGTPKQVAREAVEFAEALEAELADPEPEQKT